VKLPLHSPTEEENQGNIIIQKRKSQNLGALCATWGKDNTMSRKNDSRNQYLRTVTIHIKVQDHVERAGPKLIPESQQANVSLKSRRTVGDMRRIVHLSNGDVWLELPIND